MHPILEIVGYRYLPLAALKQRRERLLALCKGWQLKGAIVLSPEGISLRVAGAAPQVDSLLLEVRNWPGLEGLQPRLSGAQQPPFQRMTVRIKQELIALGAPDIEPARHAAPVVTPSDLARWLTEAHPLTLLDVRNDYEVRRGTFRGALHTGIGRFRELPAAISQLDRGLQQQLLVVCCTDGMRSAKASLLLTRSGFQRVLQLDGGILGYLAACGREHFHGECFEFNAAGQDPTSPPDRWVQCSNCRTPLSAMDQSHPNYSPGVSCGYCFQATAEHMALRLRCRRAQLHRLIVPLPGSQARDHFRPLRVPASCDGLSLLETLCQVVPHIPAATWEQRCAAGFLLAADDEPCSAQRQVRSGEHYRHKFPALIEPDVNMQVELLYEDEALLVVNKPAPLPMHAGGRFHRNTLKYVLDGLYHPQQPLPAHRLDANTTGVVVAARTRYIAGRLQPLFARGEVEKVYLVRVSGQPHANLFECDAPISATAGELGTRSIAAQGGLASMTRFKVLQRGALSTLLEARPLTGRTNQIRVHLWHLGLPVCGDPAYLNGGILGDSQTLSLTAPPLCLHAWQLSFQHPLHRRTVTFTAPQPAWVRDSERS